MSGYSWIALWTVGETNLGTWQIIANADPMVKLVLLILLVFSLISWAIIVFKMLALARARRSSNKFVELFWSSSNFEEVFKSVGRFAGGSVAQVFKSGYSEMRKVQDKKGEDLKGKLSTVDIVGRAMRRETTVQIAGLERMVPFLATVGSASPFIGLFGTVWGIMRAFQQIGVTGETSLQSVGPHISEALIATALGLFAAIPAVMFYNYFVNKIRGIGQSMDNFTYDFLNIVERHFGN
jgi:biopolymer transport protein TolQ